jgi:hypothetical protein
MEHRSDFQEGLGSSGNEGESRSHTSEDLAYISELEAPNVLQCYLKNLQVLAKRNRRRCISSGLGKRNQ